MIIGDEKKLIKKLKKFLEFIFKLDFKLTIGVDFLYKKYTLLNLNVKNQIWLIHAKKKSNFIIEGYLRGAQTCIISLPNKDDINNFINIVQKSHLNSDHIFLLDKKNFSELILEFISALYAHELGWIDDLKLKSYKERLPSSFKSLSEINDK